MLANSIFVKLSILILLWMVFFVKPNVLSLEILMIFLVFVWIVSIFLQIFSLTLPCTKNNFFLFFCKIFSQKIYLFVLFHLIDLSFIEIIGKFISYLFWTHRITIRFWLFFLNICVLKVYLSSSFLSMYFILNLSLVLRFLNFIEIIRISVIWVFWNLWIFGCFLSRNFFWIRFTLLWISF